MCSFDLLVIPTQCQISISNPKIACDWFVFPLGKEKKQQHHSKGRRKPSSTASQKRGNKHHNPREAKERNTTTNRRNAPLPNSHFGSSHFCSNVVLLLARTTSFSFVFFALVKTWFHAAQRLVGGAGRMGSDPSWSASSSGQMAPGASSWTEQAAARVQEGGQQRKGNEAVTSAKSVGDIPTRFGLDHSHPTVISC